MVINLKKVVMVVAIVLAVVMAGGLIMNLTGIGKKLNEENLLYDTYSDMKKTTDSNGMTVSQDNGVITIDGKTASDSGTLVKIASVELEAGTYTYTCFEKPSIDTYYSYIEYTEESVVNRVYADFDSVETTATGVTQHAKTFTLSAKTTVTVYIAVAQNYECKDVQAYPTLVSGSEAGEFYQELFK